MSGAFEHHSNTNRIITPVTLRRRIRLVQIKLDLLVEVFRSNSELSIFARPNTCEHGEIDRGGHDKAVVVVGVFADQVDTSGRAKSTRRTIDGDRKSVV